MTVNRTTLLDLPLPVTGTESGTWGDTTNNGLTQYVDIAVAGMTSLTSANFTAGALTLANTTGDSSATNIAAGSAQYGAIKVSSLATNSTITAPSSNRRYTIINADATYSATIKASGQTGVTIVAGEKALVAFNGTDYVKIATANGTGEFTTVDTTNLEVTNIKAKDGTAAATIADSTGVVTVTAAPVMTALTASQAVFTTAGKALTSNAITGTGNVVMSASPTLTGTISAAAATLSGNLTLSGGTANGVLYLDGSKVATSGSALTFDGTSLSVSGPIKLTATTTAPSVNNEFVAYSTNGYTYITGGTNGLIVGNNSGGDTRIRLEDANNIQFEVNSAEAMRLTSTGLGIGTSSPGARIDARISTSSTTAVTDVAYFYANSTGTATSSFGARLSLYTENANGNEYPASIAAVNDAGGSGLTNLAFYTYNGSLTERMRLDSSGNLGLGVTPSAWNVSYKAFQNAGGALVGVGTGEQALLNNAYIASSGNYTYINTAAASRYSLSAGAHYWFTAPSGTAGNAITFTQAMTLGSDGLFQVGTTTGAVNDGKLQVSATGTGAGTANTVVGLNVFEETSGNKAGLWFGAMTNSNVGVIGSRTASGSIAFQTYSGSWGERARITSDGNLLVGTTNNSTTVGVGVKTINSGTEPVVSIVSDTASASASAFILYNTNATNNGYRFYVQYNGGISNYQGNDANLSDRREKTNFAPAKSYLDTICAIPVQTFNYIGQSEDDPGLTLGVVAQDVQAVAPELVMESNWGTKENPKMRLSIYQTDLQYALMKCIQEQQALIESLTSRVAQLEGTQP